MTVPCAIGCHQGYISGFYSMKINFCIRVANSNDYKNQWYKRRQEKSFSCWRKRCSRRHMWDIGYISGSIYSMFVAFLISCKKQQSFQTSCKMNRLWYKTKQQGCGWGMEEGEDSHIFTPCRRKNHNKFWVSFPRKYEDARPSCGPGCVMFSRILEAPMSVDEAFFFPRRSGQVDRQTKGHRQTDKRTR